MANILIVHQHSDLCRVVARMLKEHDHVAECVESYAETTQRLKALHPNLLVLNLNTPNAAPLVQVLDHVRDDPTLHDVRTVVLAELTAPETVAQLIAAGARGYVTWERTPPDEVVRALMCWLPEGCD